MNRSKRAGAGRPAPTIYDVATLAGVSPSTVSRALNQPGRITEQTTARIKAASDELGFRFNPAARTLLTGKTGTIGLVLADITNPVVFGVIRGAERAASAAGYTLIIAESQQSGAKEADTARSLLRSVDGLVLAMSWLDDDDIRELGAEKPLVLVNREVSGIDGAYPDVEPGITQLLDHLVRRGHKMVTYLSGPERSWMNARRWESIFAGARARGLAVFEIPGGEPTVEAGRGSFDRVMASPARAVIAYNDLMAIGLLQAAQDAGVEVPRELAITGFDDIFGSTFTSPPLTTVASPLEEVAARAVESLVGHVSSRAALQTVLIVRGTS
ncbi:LacI family DNA-binding transcriptional regulator [Microbacterium sp.]|uniref:LacI family DNA-binding transcriptional regulator n=1 Tax=Microbacterium sp. TaxID=51671 RepID=UPI00289B5598|nr:LacI family DNA-binding transcriptional regulator [Microbacterium sp.]